MKGFYIYGICSMRIARPRPSAFGNPSTRAELGTGHGTKMSTRIINEDVKGIGGGKVFRISYKDIEAIVSEVSLREFGSGEIQRRALEDLEWIKDKALTHEKIIERAMNASADIIIPMKFGVVFKNRENLISSLKKDYLKFKNLLGSLRGKEEQSLKIYCKSELLENEIKKKSSMIQGRLEEIKSLPAGRRYFLEEEVKEMVEKEAKKSINNYILIFLKRLEGLVEELKENKILGKELTLRNDPMVFNGAFLVKKEKVDKFHKEIQKLRTEYEKIGFTFESSGPWPPYNFV